MCRKTSRVISIVTIVVFLAFTVVAGVLELNPDLAGLIAFVIILGGIVLKKLLCGKELEKEIDERVDFIYMKTTSTTLIMTTIGFLLFLIALKLLRYLKVSVPKVLVALEPGVAVFLMTIAVVYLAVYVVMSYRY